MQTQYIEWHSFIAFEVLNRKYEKVKSEIVR